LITDISNQKLINKDNILINNKTLDSFVKEYNSTFSRISRFVKNNKITDYIKNKLSFSKEKEISVIKEKRDNTINVETNSNKEKIKIKTKRRPLGFGDDGKIREPVNKNVEGTLQRMDRSSSKKLDKGKGN
jgi:hypothetical protein